MYQRAETRPLSCSQAVSLFISLLMYPTSPVCPDGSEKWIDYADSFWHVDCVLNSGQKMFTEHFQRFCKRHGYDYQPDRPEKLYAQAKELVSTVPKDPI